MTQHIQQSIFAEVADFLVTQPSLSDLAAYEMPASVQQHIEQLLDKNRERGLLPEERLELEKILAVVQVMKAKLKLAEQA